MIKNNWVLDCSKYLSKEEVGKLLIVARRERISNRKIAVRDCFMVYLALATGLRVMEIAALNCGDLFLEKSPYALLVREGKGKKRRVVFFNKTFRQRCRHFLAWKRRIGESVAADQPLFRSSVTGRHLTPRTLQKSIKRLLRKADLPLSYTMHSLRHTYACMLLKASDWNLRLVQKQLGHSRVTTTEVYADVLMPDITKALEKLHL